MNGKQLKNSILQWAIQGKLVPQDPNDEPASVLLEKIRAEKVRLVKEGKLKKKDLEVKPIAEEEIPFEIPKGWEWCRLKELVFNHGQKVPDKKFSYIDIGSIDNKKQKLNEKETLIEAKEAPSRARRIVCLNDIVYSTVRPYLHNMAIINKAFVAEPIASTGFAVLSCHDGLFNKYLFYYLMSPDFDEYANNGDNAKGVAYPAINDEKLYKALVPLPPLAEQHRIVAKIEELMPLVEKYGAAQDALDEWNQALPEKLKKSILQEAIQGKLVPQDSHDEPASVLLERICEEKQRLVKEGKLKKKDLEVKPIEEDEIPFEIPESWEWMRLGDMVSNQTGLSYNKGDLEKKVDNPIRVLRGGNIQNGSWTIKADDVMIAPEFVKKPNLTLQKNTFITPAVTSLEHLGKTALIEEDHSDIVAGGFVLYLLPYYREDTLVKYLSFYFQTSFYNKYCKSIANKSGQAFWNLSRQKLLDLTIPIPPLAEQRRIVAKIEELFEVIG